MKLVWPSAKLLQAAAGASFRAGHRITSSVVPLLLEQYHQHPQVRGARQSAPGGPGAGHCMGPSSDRGCAFAPL